MGSSVSYFHEHCVSKPARTQLNALGADRDLTGGKSNRVLRVLEFRYDQAVAWREK
jgi:hypothetical protein